MTINAPNEEFARRRRNLIVLGAVLCAGWLMPVVQPGLRGGPGPAMHLVTLKILITGGVPALVLVQILLPILIAITAIVFATMRYFRLRGLILIALTVAMAVVSVITLIDAQPDLIESLCKRRTDGVMLMLVMA